LHSVMKQRRDFSKMYPKPNRKRLLTLHLAKQVAEGFTGAVSPVFLAPAGQDKICMRRMVDLTKRERLMSWSQRGRREMTRP
jgi:hypothetical protein